MKNSEAKNINFLGHKRNTIIQIPISDNEFDEEEKTKENNPKQLSPKKSEIIFTFKKEKNGNFRKK